MPIKTKIKALISLLIIIVSVMLASMAAAVVATYTYDELNRLTRVDYDDGIYIAYEYDEIGNRITTTTNAPINDTTAPVTTASPVGGTYTTAQTVTLSCSDGTGSGCNNIYYTTDGSTPTTSSSVYTTALTISATTTLKYFSADVASNAETVKSQIYTIDATAPTGTVVINGGAVATNSASATLTLTCSDTNGCSQMQFSNDNSIWSIAETYAAAKAWTLTSGDGNKTVYAKYKDGAGNWSTAISTGIVLDTTVPATSASPVSGTYAAAQTVTLSCSDGTGSGCNKIYYTTDGSTPTTSSSVYTTALTISATTTLKYFSADVASNAETVKSQTYTIDATAPTGMVVINGGARIPGRVESRYHPALPHQTVRAVFPHTAFRCSSLQSMRFRPAS